MSINEIKRHGTNDFPIELYHIDKEHSRYEMDTHWHSSIEIIRVLRGTLNVRLDDRNYVQNSDSIYIVNTETIHGATPINCVYECLVFDVKFFLTNNSFINSFINDLLIKNIIINEKIIDADALDVINKIFYVLNKKDHGYQFKAVGLLQEFFGIVCEKRLYEKVILNGNLQTPKSIIKLKKALTFIHENYDKPISLIDITKPTELSTKYFCMFFKKMTNKTPIDYLNIYRVEMATKKLINTDLSVTEIAFSCGFNDLSYFIKTFKKIMGVTPRKYEA